MRHRQSYTDNQYRGDTHADVSLKQGESYLYAEYQGKTESLGYMAGVTGVRLWYSQQNNQTKKYALQPTLRITFKPTTASYLRYRASLQYQTPSLAAMNDVEQIINSWQVRRGNPELHSYHTLTQSLGAGYSQPLWGADLLISYEHEYNPIMESVFAEDTQLVRTYRNQRSFDDISAELALRIKPWKEYINLSLTPRMEHFISRGSEYRHTYTMYELWVNLDLSYHNWIASFTTHTPRRFMYGEQITKSDQMYTIMAGYKARNWSLTAGALNPFTKEFKTYNENLSALNPVESSIHTSHNKSFMVRLAFNLNYGNQTKRRTKAYPPLRQ